MMGFKVGYESFGAQSDLDYFHERMRVEGERWEIEELNWPREGEGSKIDRVQRLGPDFKLKRFFVPYPTDADNLTRFSNSEHIGQALGELDPARRKRFWSVIDPESQVIATGTTPPDVGLGAWQVFEVADGTFTEKPAGP